MSQLFGFLSVIFILTNEIICFQRFAEQPKYTEVNPGQDALLTCKIIDKRGTCSWQKDNKPVGIYPKKYEWAARPSTGGIHLDLQPPPHIGGDCSLRVLTATLDFDDGLWECQVTASDFTTQDALTSQPVRLVVRVAPQRPRLEHEGVHVPPGHNITVDSGAVATVKCVSHYGNPPAILKWYLGDQEISALGPQVNSTEPDNSRTWSAASVVQVPANKERHGEILRCLAFHESYAAKSVSVEARMDVKYSPSIRLIGSPEIDLEEDKDSLILRCVADANPPASVVWRRAGRSEIASLQESLQLRPVGRRDAGLYTCQAQNSVGTSEQLSVQLDVKYPPKILSAGPDRMTTAPLFSPAAFECVAEGNPSPTYKWVQRISHGAKYLERGNDARLVIDNVTYDYQGEYECRATNYINGQERTVTSDSVSLQVVGAPQVLRLNPSMHAVSVKKGESASLSLVVCADPRPHHVAWEWGSLRLEAGAGVDRFRADDVSQDSREDCYLATLHIVQVVEHDARPYYLVVENERGTDRHAIHLRVEEPLEMSYLLGIAGGCLAALLILICLCIYAVRGKKCCFKGGSGYKSSDKDSEKADLKSRSDSTSGGQPGGDSIYTTPAGFHHNHHPGHGSPEAMKSTTFERGGLQWPDDTTSNRHEIIQHRRHPLQTSASADTLLHRQQTVINKRASGGELLLGSQRHQRDLFSGDLGIPQITTHVGSVVHTFETMAMMRRLAEEQQQHQYRQQQYQHQQQHQQQQQQQIPMSSYEYSNECKYLDNNIKFRTKPTRSSLSHSGGTSYSKYNKLKKKSNECRQRIAQSNSVSLSSSYPKLCHSNTLKTSTTTTTATTRYSPIPTATASLSTPIMALVCPNQNYFDKNNDEMLHNKLSISPTFNNITDKFNNHNNNPQYLPNSNELIDKFYANDDYRKNHFATLPRWKRSPNDEISQFTNNNQQSLVDDVVNKAFKDIFNNHSGGGDDDDDDDDNDDVNDRISDNNRTQIDNNLHQHQHKHFLTKNKQRSTTLTNIFDRMKIPKSKTFKKIPSENVLINEQTHPLTTFAYIQQKFSPTFNLHRGLDEEDEAQFINDDNENFLRGSTVSQSFIKNVRNVKNHHNSSGKLANFHQNNKQQQNKYHQYEYQTQFRPKSTTTQNRTENLLMNQQKRSKSSNELLSFDEHEPNLKNKFTSSNNSRNGFHNESPIRTFNQNNSSRNFFHENRTTNDDNNDDGGFGVVRNNENDENELDGFNIDSNIRPSKKGNSFRPRTIDRAEI